MSYFNNRYKGVRTEDHETYMGFPSEEFHSYSQRKSKVYGGEYLDLEDRKQLKYLQEEKHITKGDFSVGSTGHYHETAIARDINNVKKRRG